jgi:hypothetical protein
MGVYKFFDRRVRRLSLLDYKLAQAAAMCVMFIIIKLIPEITNISIIWPIMLGIVLALRPMYVIFRRDQI